MGLKLEIFLDRREMAEILLAIVAQTYMSPGRRSRNPEIKTSNKRRGKKSGRRLDVTVVRVGMGDGRTRGGPSRTINPPDELGVLNSSRSSKGEIGTSRRWMGCGEERVGLRREMRRFLSARTPRASPCSKLPRFRNPEVKAKSAWNIVNSRC